MRLFKLIIYLLLTALLALGASSVVSAKVASGDQNLLWSAHLGDGVVNWLTLQGKSARCTTGPPGSPVATKSAIDPKKFNYLFGKSTSNAHNAARSNQLSREMKRLGIFDDAAGHKVLSEHFAQAANQQGNVLRTFTTKHGAFEVRDSLLFGPSGKAIRLETTFQIMSDGARRFTTTIPKR